MISRRGLILCAAMPVVVRAGEQDPDEMARRIFVRINELRVIRGAGALVWSDSLAACARQQSERKVLLRFPGHNDPERGDVAARLNAAGVRWSRCAENLFMEKGWEDPVNFAVVSWWYSAGHQENLLNPEYRETGLGLAQGADGAWFVTQIFIDPFGLRNKLVRADGSVSLDTLLL
jgi:uncharacterized protein YkwD